jgi:hypothetical protein
MIDLVQGHSMLDVAPDAPTHRLMLPVLGSSALGDRLPLNCGCTLVVTTNPKIQGSRGGSFICLTEARRDAKKNVNVNFALHFHDKIAT